MESRSNMTRQFYRRYGKRLFDLVVSGTALLILSPILAVTALLVRRYLGSPVLFCQERPGYQTQLFQICKFRSMTDARGPNGEFLDDSLRHTPFGKFLRSSSLDELPELWNVFVGQMSLVGPRPLRTHFLPYYNAEQSRRHDVMPGITGWAQVNGRNQSSWEDRFRCDVWYVDNMSFSLDLKILWMTVMTVVSRKAVDAEDGGEFPDFTGTKEDLRVESYERPSDLQLVAPGFELYKSFQNPLNDEIGSEIREFVTPPTGI